MIRVFLMTFITMALTVTTFFAAHGNHQFSEIKDTDGIVIAASNGPRIILDGQILNFDVPPVIEKGRTLVPMRIIFETLGASVKWDHSKRTVTVTKPGTQIKLFIGGKAYKNGLPITLDVPASLVSGRTMVPLRFVGESLGCQVEWDEKSQTVKITSPSKLISTSDSIAASAAGTVMGKINYTKTLFGNARLPILMFHTVNDVKLPGALEPMWTSSFRMLMERLYSEGYETITTKQAYDYNIKGIRLPEKSIWLTFDDGWADNLTHAAPILAEYGYVATVFVETSKMGGYLRINADQVAELRSRYNWDIQPHGHVGHQPIDVDGSGKKGSFYNDLKWLPDLSRVETMEERHTRVKADLQSSIKITGQYSKPYSFAYPSSQFGATDEIKADNDRVMDELGIMGVNVGKTGGEQIVPLNSTSPHRLCRLGIAGDTSFEKLFNIQNFGLFVLVDGNSYYTKHPVYDRFNDRFISGSVDGKILTFGKDWIIKLKPVPVKKPPVSSRPEPTSNIVPTVLSNGDIWVGSVSGPSLYRLDLKDLSRPASREIPLDFKPYNVVSDGENIYAFDTDGVIRKIETSTGTTSHYCTLPGGSSASYLGSVLADGILYAYDSRQNQILKYDFRNKKLIKYITWEPRDYQLQPWHVIDHKTLLTFCNKNWRHVALEYE